MVTPSPQRIPVITTKIWESKKIFTVTRPVMRSSASKHIRHINRAKSMSQRLNDRRPRRETRKSRECIDTSSCTPLHLCLPKRPSIASVAKCTTGCRSRPPLGDATVTRTQARQRDMQIAGTRYYGVSDPSVSPPQQMVEAT